MGNSVKDELVTSDGQRQTNGGRRRQLVQAVDKLGAKPFIILLLVLLFLIPINMIQSLVRDREYYRDEAIRSVLLPKGGEPVLEGVLMAIPYTHTVLHHYVDSDNQERVRQETTTRYLFSVPQTMDYFTRVEPEYLTRGIFDVPVFACETKFSGIFSPAAYQHLKISERDIRWDEALLLFGISNKKNLTSLPVITVDGAVLEQSFTEPVVSPFRNALYYNLPADFARNGFSYQVDARIQGGESISIVPLATDNNFSMESTWRTPGFSGGWLPTERELGEEGFSAFWSIPGLSTTYPKVWVVTEDNQGIAMGKDGTEAVQVGFVTPVDNYQKTSRSVKYAVLFLIIPFLAIFIFEIFTKVRIHPIQYCLIGLADVVFYLLLLSVSEHLDFSLTYWISSAAVSFLSLFYAATIFHKFKWGVLFAAVQFISYIFLFGTLQAEDYALLIGTLGLFFVVVVLMVLTRKVDWYSMTSQRTGE